MKIVHVFGAGLLACAGLASAEAAPATQETQVLVFKSPNNIYYKAVLVQPNGIEIRACGRVAPVAEAPIEEFLITCQPQASASLGTSSDAEYSGSYILANNYFKSLKYVVFQTSSLGTYPGQTATMMFSSQFVLDLQDPRVMLQAESILTFLHDNSTQPQISRFTYNLVSQAVTQMPATVQWTSVF